VWVCASLLSSPPERLPEKSMNGSSNMRGAGREGRTMQCKGSLMLLVVLVVLLLLLLLLLVLLRLGLGPGQ